MNGFDVLKERGFIKQTIFEDELIKKMEQGSVMFYVGFDPTADSLHIGHYIPVMAMAHMQKAGHTPIALIGGGTAMVGDPSHRTDMRKMMTPKIIADNSEAFRKQLSRFLRFSGENAAVMANNADWLLPLNYVDFIRDIGAYFSVNKMLTADCFKTRLEKGLSFLEFNYMLMQGYDFLVLNQRYGCGLQLGGNDQWSNMLAGVDLIRRKEQKDAFCMTLTLLEKSDGEKMGKTASGALWLDPVKTPPYDFFQYFRNVEDQKVEECFKLLTFLPIEEISVLCEHKDERLNAAKKRLAYEVTLLVHGKEEADNALVQAEAAFSGNLSNMPEINIAFSAEMLITGLITAAGLCASKGDARRLIEGGGITVNGQKIESAFVKVSELAVDGTIVIHKGKKVRIKVNLT